MTMKKRQNSKGFTLMEMIVASTILLIIVSSIYALILRTQRTHLTEDRKLDMNQAARALEVLLYDDIRSAGAVLSLLHTPTFLGSPAPFTGIYPLNNNNFPDGIIIASGDPLAITESTGDFTPGSHNTINVTSTDTFDGTQPAWGINDFGLVSRAEGYYVFKVVQAPALGDTSLSIRSTAVYYSGLLNTANYDDLTDDHNIDSNNSGSDYTYFAGSPVIRLNYFNILLVKEQDGVRTLTLTTDTEGEGNVLADGKETTTRAVPFVPNIEDIQFEFVTKPIAPTNVADFWAASATDGSGGTAHANPCSDPNGAECKNFINQFVGRNIASIRVYALFKTEEEREKHAGSGIKFDKPRMGDVAAVTLPVGRFHYSYMRYEIAIRNYHIAY
jgi:prepilin-type N-terminal cleavage/methylation domain-containing protein